MPKYIKTSKIQCVYKPGMRIKLIRMHNGKLPPIGTEGTILGVDAVGSIMVSWDTGIALNVIPDEDEFEIVL